MNDSNIIILQNAYMRGDTATIEIDGVTRTYTNAVLPEVIKILIGDELEV